VRRVGEDGVVWTVFTDQSVEDPTDNGWDDDE